MKTIKKIYFQLLKIMNYIIIKKRELKKNKFFKKKKKKNKIIKNYNLIINCEIK